MIISHRGESADAPENTMAAFQLAVEHGVDAMECDVYVTADGVPVIMHDKSMRRTTGVNSNITDLPVAT
ncbi:MAG: glycerophosphodiester phosphodiesterase, partial [Kiritimatiellae bacterium]|nr:glycerophosphodiester phosphodiesterase [Kiritimatiellia bacterium]